jgi:hypothetical protein
MHSFPLTLLEITCNRCYWKLWPIWLNSLMEYMIFFWHPRLKILLIKTHHRPSSSLLSLSSSSSSSPSLSSCYHYHHHYHHYNHHDHRSYWPVVNHQVITHIFRFWQNFGWPLGIHIYVCMYIQIITICIYNNIYTHKMYECFMKLTMHLCSIYGFVYDGYLDDYCIRMHIYVYVCMLWWML